MGRLVALDSGYAGEHFALDSFEKGAASGRYIRNFVGETELVDACNRVTATNEREGAVLGCNYNSVGYCSAAGSEVVEFEYACRAVPKDSLGGDDSLGEELAGLGTASMPSQPSGMSLVEQI